MLARLNRRNITGVYLICRQLPSPWAGAVACWLAVPAAAICIFWLPYIQPIQAFIRIIQGKQMCVKSYF